MTKIYLIRHGEARATRTAVHGWYDSLLTKKAIEKQLPPLRERFSKIRLMPFTQATDAGAQDRTAHRREHALPLIPEPGSGKSIWGNGRTGRGASCRASIPRKWTRGTITRGTCAYRAARPMPRLKSGFGRRF